MILYNETQNLGFSDFGIQIPVTDDQAIKTFERLCGHPLLKDRISRWHRRPDEERLTEEDLLRVHSSRYVERLFSDHRETELIRTYELVSDDGRYNRYDPSSAALPLGKLFDRILKRAAGTVQCCRIALETGFCFHFGGGMHHAVKDRGRGFCPVNDIMIALRKLQAEGRIASAWVIDTDAHKGDGTAALAANDETIRTLSIHMASGWPLDRSPENDSRRHEAPFIANDIDIPIESGEEVQYVPKLIEGLERLKDLSTPDFALVVYGADPYEKDALPSTQGLKLTLDQMLERDMAVYRFLVKENIPMGYLMAGGYGPDAWEVYVQFLEKVLPERMGNG